jgi:transcription antitermination protein NusB
VSAQDLRKIREATLQFLYQNEQEKIFVFSDSHLSVFIKNFNIPSRISDAIQSLTKGVIEKRPELDDLISKHLNHWKMDRLAKTDLVVLRIAAYELLESTTPTAVILNEAIELAQEFGSSKSGSFVNGVLDNLARAARKSS